MASYQCHNEMTLFKDLMYISSSELTTAHVYPMAGINSFPVSPRPWQPQFLLCFCEVHMIEGLFTIAKLWKQPKRPSVDA